MRYYIARADTNGEWDVIEELEGDDRKDLLQQAEEWGRDNLPDPSNWLGVWILDENRRVVDV